MRHHDLSLATWMMNQTLVNTSPSNPWVGLGPVQSKTMQIDVYDPVLCCSTGVCGPQVDPVLVRFATDLRWVEEGGGQVRRFNLGQNPAAFVANELVRGELTRGGEAVLPLVLVDGRIAFRGRYPDREELTGWLRATPTAGSKQDPSAGCGCRGGAC